MAINPVSPDDNGIVSFRKSVYDDDGNALTVQALELVQTNTTVHDPAKDPAWLSYTTTTEQTQEGPSGQRRYLHVDVSIDTTALTDGDVYYLHLVASDGSNNVDQTFRYKNSLLTMNALSGCVLWFKPEREENKPENGTAYDSATNFGTGSDLIDTGGATFNSDGIDTIDTAKDGSTLSPGFPVLPPGSDGAAFSVFMVFTGYRGFLTQGNGGAGGRALYHDREDVELHAWDGGSADTYYRTAVSFPTSEVVLLEYHRRPGGPTLLFHNGTQILSEQVPVALANSNTSLLNNRTSDAAEVIAYQADLTNDEIEAVRKQIDMQYPSLTMDSVTATSFG